MIQFRQSQEVGITNFYARATIGASGAVTLDVPNSLGVLSITKAATAGQYVVVFGFTEGTRLFPSPYNRVLSIHSIANVQNVSGTPALSAAPIVSILSNSVAVAGTASVTLQYCNLSGVATNPASGEILHIDFCLSDSTAS